MAGKAEFVGRWSAAERWLGALRHAGRGLLELVFPGCCLSCGAALAAGDSTVDGVSLCAECIAELELFQGPVCGRCGAARPELAPAVTTRGAGCVYCAGRKLWFDRAVAVGRYSGRLRQLVLRMKQWQGDALSLALGRLLAARCGAELSQGRVDVVVPVPMHWRRRLAHGTNSAAVLAEVLAGRLRSPLAERLLRRNRHTPPQSSLTPPQRWDNVRRAFSVRGGYHLHEAHVLVVDDILTTGATCSEAARTLRRAGAARVTVAVVARSFSP